MSGSMNKRIKAEAKTVLYVLGFFLETLPMITNESMAADLLTDGDKPVSNAKKPNGKYD